MVGLSQFAKCHLSKTSLVCVLKYSSLFIFYNMTSSHYSWPFCGVLEVLEILKNLGLLFCQDVHGLL